MDLNTVIKFLLIAGVIHGFVFNLVTIFFKKRFTIVVLYLNLVVLFISLNNLQAWLIEIGYSSNHFYIKNMLVPWYFFILPMFYAFVIHFLEVDKKIVGFVKFAIIVFVVEVVLRSFVIAYTYYYVEGLSTSIIEKYTIFEDVFNLALSIAIFYKCIELVFQRENTYKKILSYNDLKWLKLFFKLGGVVIFFWVVAKLGDFLFGIDWGYSLLRLSTSVLLYWIGYQGFYHYNVVQDRIQLRESIARNSKSVSFIRPKESGPIKHKLEFEHIHKYITENMKYMEPDISLNSLADTLEVSPSHLSKLINTYSSYNFSDYINSLRVEQSKKFLADPDFNHYTIVSIGLECGFNSRSTFYSSFKKFTLKTPSEFLNEFEYRPDRNQA